jgi:hypothetical protein
LSSRGSQDDEGEAAIFRIRLEMMSEAVLLESFFTAVFETRGGFPRCFCDIIAFPFDIVLISSASFPMIEDRFDFIAFFVVVDVRWRSGEVGAVDFVSV